MPGTAAWNIEKDIGTDLASRDVILIRYPPARERKRRTARRATHNHGAASASMARVWIRHGPQARTAISKRRGSRAIDPKGRMAQLFR
jgi:hypothetical protein